MKRWVWRGLIFFFILFSLVPTGYELMRRNDLHSNRYFELVHNFYTDYNFYLSRIRQGREGAWLAQEKYTSEPHKGSLIQEMYIVMGQVSRFVRVPWPNSGDTYHMARVVFGVLLLAMIAFVAQSAFTAFSWQVTAFLLSVLAGSWPTLTFHNNEWRSGGYMAWWSIMDALQRITFIPHMIVGQALIAFLLIALADTATLRKPMNWLFLGVIGLLLGIIFPPGLLFVYAVIGLLFALELMFDKPWKQKTALMSWFVERIGGRAVFGVIGLPSFLYLSLALGQYPWKRLTDYSVLHPPPFVLSEYVTAMGPMLWLGAIGLVVALVKKERRMFIFVAWAIMWWLLIILFGYIPQESPLRFTEMLPHVPLAVLTTYLFYEIFVRTGSRMVKGWKVKALLLRAIHNSVFIIPVVLVLVGLVQMYSSVRWQQEFVDHKIIATYPLVPTGSYVMYPLKDFISAMIFIQDATPRNTVVLAETTAGNYLPVYSGNTVYVGHAGTVNTEVKEQKVRQFFAGHMHEDEAKQWLTEEDLHIIFFGPQERDDGGLTDLTRAYPFLKEIYTNSTVKVYRY